MSFREYYYALVLENSFINALYCRKTVRYSVGLRSSPRGWGYSNKMLDTTMNHSGGGLKTKMYVHGWV